MSGPLSTKKKLFEQPICSKPYKALPKPSQSDANALQTPYKRLTNALQKPYESDTERLTKASIKTYERHTKALRTPGNLSTRRLNDLL